MKKPIRESIKKPSKNAFPPSAAKVVKPATSKSAAKPVAVKPAAAKVPAARMSLSEVMAILEKLGTEQTRKTWARHGAKGPMFGVLFGELFKLMKRIDVDHELARELWATGNVDARNLAMKIADPMAMTPSELDRWAIENPLRMCNLYIATLAAEGPHARSKLHEWMNSSNESLLASGWTLLGRLSDLDESFPEDQLLSGIESIEKSIHSAPNDVKSDMNRTLITIGGRSSATRKAVLAAAKRIGEVTVDHGQTACKTPDVAQAVEKSWARSEAKFGSPAAHERSMKSMRRRC
ncbi:MAG: DNA alkylation repair protein [Pirellula sp.]|nr:DNA alkylation repair protein [Pirellula sp.]